MLVYGLIFNSFEEKNLTRVKISQREACMNVWNGKVLTDCILILESNFSVT